MTRSAAPKVGTGPCPHCGKATVMFKRSAGGMLTFKADLCCFSSGYAEPGGEAYAKWNATIKPIKEDPREPEPEPEAPAPAPAPARRVASSVFNLEDL